MASKELNVIIKHRCDTSENWTINNPVLLAGEFGVEVDTGRIKVGDGLTDWSNLNYYAYDEVRDKGLSGQVRLRNLSAGTYKIANQRNGSLRFYYNYWNENDYILISDGFIVISEEIGSTGKQFFGMGQLFGYVKNGSYQQCNGIGFIIGYTNSNNADFEISFINNYIGPDKIVMFNELMYGGKIKKDFVDLSDVVNKEEWNSYNDANSFKVINSIDDVPTADEASEGKMIFYLGPNSTTPYVLLYGHYYKCTYVDGNYEWTNLTQDANVEGVANSIREINKHQPIQLWVGTKEELEDETTQPNVAYVPVDVDIKETFDEVLTDMSEDENYKFAYIKEDENSVLKINGDEIISRKKMIYENTEGTYEINTDGGSLFNKRLEIVYGIHEAVTTNAEALCFNVIQFITSSKKCVFNDVWSVGVDSLSNALSIMGITITVENSKISIQTKQNGSSSINLLKIYKVYEIIE